MLTVATDDDTFQLDVEPGTTLELLAGVLEAETGVPRRPAAAAPARGAQQGGAPSASDQAEMLRQQIIADPQLMAQLRSARPQLAEAVHGPPERFLELLNAERQAADAATLARQRAEMELAAADEFDIDAQRRIEEAIRQERVMENLESAMEYNPEAFGTVTMLYVDSEVNGVKASHNHEPGLCRALRHHAAHRHALCGHRARRGHGQDPRPHPPSSGACSPARHGAIADSWHSSSSATSSSSPSPSPGVDFLFGLDQLKRHQMSIDLAQNALICDGRKIRFLSEHELPASATFGEEDAAATSSGAAAPAAAAAAGSSAAAPASSSAAALAPRAQAPPAPAAPAPPSAPAPAAGSRWPAESVQQLRDLGATESQAIAMLDAAGGNVDAAASFLFQ
ncbi:hypothetical protein FA09DRAFT_107943 [Tilletiopsis washingtonensis]|uniref:UBA domain-containing protein n=1 Tax=Tilletiopsis washingtonensis TaxID=58919 RepID=A0A316ZHX1_9BASI|nr:hypothetical protein FA09DRAFT_107943 [Tilletiopsis washingtonensis]PWO00639.1 hypothetical protein FA09DRAFT_107943 [Tilletiopsis washingtonensis]